MYKKLILIALCFCLPLLGDNSSLPQNENLQIGRYQMVAVVKPSNETQLYLLDTTTGHVWKSTTKNNWLQHDFWQPQISSLEHFQ